MRARERALDNRFSLVRSAGRAPLLPALWMLCLTMSCTAEQAPPQQGSAVGAMAAGGGGASGRPMDPSPSGLGGAGVDAATPRGGQTSDGGSNAGLTDGATADVPSGEAAGSTSTAGCAHHNYQVCIDFESGIDTTVWNGGTPGSIVTSDAAHGTHSYRLRGSANCAADAKGCEPAGGRLTTTKVGTIKNQVWSRFYIHFKPGAPGGHGNILAAYDEGGRWYEIGYQFDGIMGVWHGGGGETPLRSMPLIVDRWYCVEAYFDGATAAMPRWWIDGTEAAYYMPGGGPKVAMATQFARLEAGLSPYAGFGLRMPDGKGDQTETRVLTDLWIDDIAFDTQRIGCIAP